MTVMTYPDWMSCYFPVERERMLDTVDNMTADHSIIFSVVPEVTPNTM